MYRPHSACRACGLGAPASSTLKQSTAAGSAYDKIGGLIPAFDLGISPLANDFCEAAQERAGYAPLKVMLCPQCGLAQLSVVVNPEVLYRNYPYITSNSAMMRKHFSDLRYDIGEEAGDFKTLLEIGSNDGTLMLYFQEHGAKCVGIDPAFNLTQIANKRAALSLPSPFSGNCDKWVLANVGRPDVILARHVFAHVDDWREFVQGLEMVSGDYTLICLEVPYVCDQLDAVSWDQIYHEHLSYVSVRPIEALLRGSSLRLHRVIHYDIHGGCILLMLRSVRSQQEPHPSVSNYLSAEQCGPDRWKAFGLDARNQTDQLCSFVRARVAEGKTVVGYGASAKSTQWINACHFTKKEIRFVCDSTPQKCYKQCPGSDIPVCDEGALTRELPDYAICFAWNFANEIIEKEKVFRSKGGKWIVPVPKLQVL